MSKLLLVRHGNTKLNSHERFWGQTDVELGDDGIEQAEHLRDRLASFKIDAIYASNLSRTKVTAEIIAARQKSDVVTCAELSEINFGYVEGLTFEEISQRYPDLAERLADWSISPEFPGGENFKDFNKRVSKFIPRLENHAPEETILIVAHAGSLRLLICNLMKINIRFWRQMRLGLASLSILETHPQGATLMRLNDISHLETEEINRKL